MRHRLWRFAELVTVPFMLGGTLSQHLGQEAIDPNAVRRYPLAMT